ncbi:sigma-70 family RNA polymerase sigma factor [Pendulispora rubella]|uniref:Sigma-70 family RNA polymerase sigma factor n=1 Tax=Pendulispora rubella TaxID=2741070 RepID=A0ABZ2L864_9BACT
MSVDDWSSSTFREALVALVRRRVPEKDAEDVVQATLAEAMAAAHRPEDPEALRKWIYGITRNKIADYHRRARREVLDEPEALEAASSMEEVNDLLRWAVRELPSGQDAQQTFQWFLREGEGEKLEAIADGEKIPPARVRQRVSRLRRHFRDRWAAQLAALAALGVVGIVVAIWILRDRPQKPDAPIARDTAPIPQIAPTPRELAIKERNEALVLCDEGKWKECIEKLDRAAFVVPELNDDADVKSARAAAAEALRPKRDSRIQLPETQDSAHGSDWFAPVPSSTPPPRRGRPKGTGTTTPSGIGTGSQ